MLVAPFDSYLCFCFPQESARGYHCHCPPGFVGTHCEIQRNKCNSKPCQNGGQCHAVLDSFVCECPPEFAGQLCEVSLMFHMSQHLTVIDAVTAYVLVVATSCGYTKLPFLLLFVGESHITELHDTVRNQMKDENIHLAVSVGRSGDPEQLKRNINTAANNVLFEQCHTCDRNGKKWFNMTILDT